MSEEGKKKQKAEEVKEFSSVSQECQKNSAHSQAQKTFNLRSLKMHK